MPTDGASREETPRNRMAGAISDAVDACFCNHAAGDECDARPLHIQRFYQMAYDAGRSWQVAPPTPQLIEHLSEKYFPPLIVEDIRTKLERGPVQTTATAVNVGQDLNEKNRKACADAMCELAGRLSDSSPAGAAPEPKVEDAITLLRKIEACSGDAAKLILLRNFCGQARHFIQSEAGAAPQWVSVRVQVCQGWHDAGREALCLTNSFEADGVEWVTLQWLDDLSEEGIEVFKVRGLIRVDSLPAPPRGVTDHA